MSCRIFAVLITLQIILLSCLVGGVFYPEARRADDRQCNKQLVRFLALTDFAIWTGARYTRHISQADVFSAFQDSMGALEHFPEGIMATFPAQQRFLPAVYSEVGDDAPF